MSFCPKCDNFLDISKTILTKLYVNIEESPSEISDDTKIDNIENLINTYIKNKTIQIDDINNIYLEQIINHQSYKKLDKTTKTELNTYLQNLYNTVNDSSNSAYYICKVCNYSEVILKDTLIISKKNSDTSSNYLKTNSYKNMYKVLSLPRTTNYKCINEKCDSFKDNDKKIAVFFRDQLSYQIWYSCLSCKSYWKGH